MQSSSDYLINIGRSAVAKKVIRSLGLPIPLPEQLERGEGPWVEEPLAGRTVVVDGFGANVQAAALAREILRGAGASLKEKSNRGSSNLHALVYDATQCRSVADLTDLYRFFNESLSAVRACGRYLIIGADPQFASTPREAAVQSALCGFVKSLAKEAGRRGATAQLFQVAPTALNRLAGPLRFFLSERSAFISGQAITISDEVKDAGPASWSQPLAGKLALVTGAARGIGRQLALTLAREGANVIGLDRPEESAALDALASETKGVALPVDLLAEDVIERVRDVLAKHGGGLDILVNNAGITRDKTLTKMSKEAWTLTLAVNLEAVMALTDGLLARGLNDHGRVIAMASVNGIAGAVGQTNYAASKAGLIGYVQALADQAKRRRITVNAIAPGFIETKMTQGIPLAMREAGRRFNALSQGGLPEDVAEAATFLASPGASGISGTVLRVCGLNFVGA